MFTPLRVSRAKLARRICAIMGCPSCKYFQNMERIHTIKNCPLTIQDVTAANTTFGIDLGLPKGKTVRTTSSRVVHNYETIPVSICQLHLQINLVVNIMYTNYLLFLVTVSRHIKYTTLMFINIQKQSQLVTGITKAIKVYPKSTDLYFTILTETTSLS